MCSGRVDMDFIIKAFSNGMDGVFVGACRLAECNYITHGNYHALNLVLTFKKIMNYIGLNPERLRIEFMSSGEGIRFAEVVNDFTRKIRELGPLGVGEGLDENTLKFKLEAVKNLVPYIRLVERERLRVHFDTLEKYNEFFTGEEASRLLQELILDKLAISEIMLLLRDRPLSVSEISGILGLNPSEVSRHLNSSAKQGLVRFNEHQKRFTTA
jgi:F420-non-reducing hydrogenase iron-sulfur subunit